METLELEIKKYIDLNQYETIPALDEAIKDIEEGRVYEIKDIDEFFNEIRWEIDNEV